MRALLLMSTGFASLALGIVFLPLPTPFGIPLFMIGAALILMASPTARARFKTWRSSHRGESDRLLSFERYLPGALRKALDETHPDGGAATPDTRRDAASRLRREHE